MKLFDREAQGSCRSTNTPSIRPRSFGKQTACNGGSTGKSSLEFSIALWFRFVSAACPDDLTQSIDEDSFFTISSIVYTPFSSNSLTLPKPKPPTPVFNFVQHDEYLAIGERIGNEDFPIDDISPALANQQLQVRCFQELRQRRYQPRYNGTDGFYVSTVEKFDALYGTWTIRAKLPSKVQISMRLALTDDHCRPPICPPLVEAPATVMRLHPLIETHIQFQTDFTLDNGAVDQSFRGTKKLQKYEDSFHTYEIIWQADSLDWRIDGKVVAGYFDPAMIPQEKMVFHVSVFCPDDDFTQSFDEDSSFTISSIVHTPFSSGSPTLERRTPQFATSPATPSTTTSSTSEGPELDEPRNDGLETTTATPFTLDRSVDLIADKYRIIVDAIKNITSIVIRINKEQWMKDLGLAKSKSNG
ncbi:hypothetical protein RvY_10441 [Ramazzottius varieornatus]|uniref:GH16 domain-containing protein n=1 Tax=Ramazzottius varieornatus TaxID=947166 RepID=A0A1D1VCR9_RAMVA|nr:hypothetical protein RvY_10441 [Ramazzottius varieornatus]